jgi:hypothetical protein
MCEHRLRNRNAGTIGHGTVLGAAGYFCAGARHVHHGKYLTPETGAERMLNAQSSTWKLLQQRDATRKVNQW